MPAELSGEKPAEAPPLLTPLEAETTPAPLPARCANCEARLTGPFCAQCGQHAADYHRSIWRLIVGFFDNVFSWDSKFFRTLGPLLVRPGFLTREFLVGRRTRYVHPLRLFLFTSAVCLTLLQFGRGQVIQTGTDTDKNGIQINFDDPNDKDDDDKPTPGPSPAASAAPTASPAASAASPGPSPTAGTVRKKRPHEEPDNAFERYMEDFGKRLKQKKKQLGKEEFNREVSSKLQSSLSWVALTMLPLFALMLRSLYWRRDSYYFDHLIYSLHYHTFLLLLMTAYRAVSGVVDWTHLVWLKVPVAFGLLIPPWYLYRSLKRLFGESRLRTWLKVFLIGGLHLLALLIGLTIIGMTSLLSLT